MSEYTHIEIKLEQKGFTLSGCMDTESISKIIDIALEAEILTDEN